MLSVYIGQESCPSLSMQSYNTAAKFILQFLLYLIVEFSFHFLFSCLICELCVNIPSFIMLRNEGYFKHILMGHVIFTLQFVPNADFPLGRKMTVVAYHQENCRVTHMFVHFFLLFMWLLNKYEISIVPHIFLGTWDSPMAAEFILCRAYILVQWLSDVGAY